MMVVIAVEEYPKRVGIILTPLHLNDIFADDY